MTGRVSGAGISSALVDVMLIEYPAGLYVVLADQVSAISEPEGVAELERGSAALDLDGDLLSGAEEITVELKRRIIVRVDGGTAELLTSGDLQLSEVERSAFFSLPRVLAVGGCAPWVRGVMIPNSSVPGERLALWLDLAAFAARGLDGSAQRDVVQS